MYQPLSNCWSRTKCYEEGTKESPCRPGVGLLPVPRIDHQSNDRNGHELRSTNYRLLFSFWESDPHSAAKGETPPHFTQSAWYPPVLPAPRTLASGWPKAKGEKARAAARAQEASKVWGMVLLSPGPVCSVGVRMAMPPSRLAGIVVPPLPFIPERKGLKGRARENKRPPRSRHRLCGSALRARQITTIQRQTSVAVAGNREYNLFQASLR